MEDTQNLMMDWDAVLTVDSQEYILLPEGDYNFSVTSCERGRFAGSAKIQPCNKMTITVSVNTDNGIATAKFDLILYTTLEWKLSSFFRCIGQKKRGEKIKMDWDKVVGSVGRGHFKPREYIGKMGETRQTNDIDKFYDYDPTNFPTVSTATPPKQGVKFEAVNSEDELPF